MKKDISRRKKGGTVFKNFQRRVTKRRGEKTSRSKMPRAERHEKKIYPIRYIQQGPREGKPFVPPTKGLSEKKEKGPRDDSRVSFYQGEGGKPHQSFGEGSQWEGRPQQRLDFQKKK